MVRTIVMAIALGIAVSTPARADGATPLRVFAAASLSEAFVEIAEAFEKSHPGASVRLNLAGSQQLGSQLEHGAGADVFAPADARWMDRLRERSRLAGDPATFARNRLAVIVPRANPARIARLQDLAKSGVKLVIGAGAVPVGAYTRALIANLSDDAGFPDGFARQVLANVVSEEESVKSVAGKVRLGEADAGIVYRSDVTPALARHVREIAIPDSSNVFASYPIAVVKDAPDAARAFVELVLSPAGQRILVKHRLTPAGGDALPVAPQGDAKP